MASTAIARVGLFLLTLPTSTLGQSNWQLVAPRTATLPSGEPPSSFARKNNVVSPVGVTDSLNGRPSLLQTNKFYSNFVLDGSSRSAWTLPYIVTVNEEYPFGMYVSYPKYYAGQTESDGRIKWYAASSAKDIILSAKELQAREQVAKLTDFDDEGLSATVSITTKTSSKGSIETYLVRGMAYATAKYENYTPEIASVHAILRVNGVSASSRSHTSSDGRFAMELNDGSTWMLYYSGDEELQLNFASASDNGVNALKGNVALTGTLRAALVPYGADSPEFEKAVELLDQYAGTYPTKGALRAWMHTTRNIARYKIIWYTKGEGSGLLHYALPHQQDLLDSSRKTGLYLRSPTKGEMELVTGRFWTMTERSLPDIEWVPTMSYITNNVQRDWIGYYLEQEIALSPQSIAGESVYFGAKHLMAYAQLCLVASELARNDLVEGCVDKVEAGFDIYLRHENGNPLVYDEIWGGVIGSLGLEEGKEGADFYAVYYNDHHFHYSYLVNAAAVLSHLRPSWVTDEHKEWVETLIRDVSNPNKNDDYFPQFRSFDWFCGHSWARGLLFAYDGKDQESTSEDVNFSYAMTMWAMATGNTRLEGLGRLQTAVVTRSINAYFLLKDSNTNHPADFVRNKVTGIFFESKVDYTTWFGNNVEYIHGIQNIPVTAITESVRDPEFVSQEWDQRLESIASDAGGSWKTVLFMSYATVQKNLAFAEMLTSGVDDGLRRSWALYWAASRPDCTKYCEHRELDFESPPSSTPTPVPSGDRGGGSSGSAYEGIAAVIPGTIQVERFDYGGEGVAYSDTDAGNNGGMFRTDESVDILEIGNEQGYNLGWLRAGEYLRYTVNISKTVSKFNFSFLVAAPPGRSGELQVVAGGSGCSDYDTDLSGAVSILSTGSWTNFEPLEVEGKGGLSSGENTLWLCILSAGFNIDSFTMSTA